AGRVGPMEILEKQIDGPILPQLGQEAIDIEEKRGCIMNNAESRIAHSLWKIWPDILLILGQTQVQPWSIWGGVGQVETMPGRDPAGRIERGAGQIMRAGALAAA